MKNKASILIQNALLLKNVNGHLSLQDQHVFVREASGLDADSS